MKMLPAEKESSQFFYLRSMESKERSIVIRPEKAEDETFITEINTLAFERPDEANLIIRLRDSEAFIPELSLVAEENGRIIGHILFTHLMIKNNDSQFPSLTLAPMAVHPDRQKQGIGGLLIKHGLAKAKEMKFSSVIVLGHDKYYPKFGFQPASQWGIICPFPVPDEAFMAIELQENGLSGVKGIVQYPAEFNDVS